MARDKDIITLPSETSETLVSYRDKGFKRFFEGNLKKVLKKKSIYDIIEMCFNAGYWYAVKDVGREKELYEAAQKTVEEIRKQISE